MGWYTRCEAAEILGLGPKGVESRRRKGKLKSKPNPDHKGRMLYWVDAPEPSPDSPLPSMTAEREEGERYIFSRDSDGVERYIIKHRSLGGAHRTYRADQIEAIWRAYTTGGAQINECALELGITRVEFVEIKTALGLTKTSAPWTPEHVEATGEDELVQDALALKTRGAMVRAERAHWRHLKACAEKWITGPGAVLAAVEGMDLAPVPIPEPPRPHADHITVIGLSDLHLGKRPHKGIDSPSLQAERAAHIIARAIDKALRWGPPRRWYLHCGGDLLHVDTASYTTTRGTPQGGQSTGSVIMMVEAAIKVMGGAIEALAAHAPVTVVAIPGNHDRLLAPMVGMALRERYRGVEGVTVDVGEGSRRAYRVFDVPVLFDHGDAIKARDYPVIMAREMPVGCRIGKAIVFRGHLHQAAHEEYAGVDVVTMPSPGPPDDWHVAMGYSHKPRLGVYRIEASGLEGLEYA